MTKICSVCNKPLGNNFLYAKGSHFHSDCYNGPINDIETVTAIAKMKVKPKGDLRQYSGTAPKSDEEKDQILKENIVDTLDGDYSTQRDDD